MALVIFSNILFFEHIVVSLVIVTRASDAETVQPSYQRGRALDM